MGIAVAVDSPAEGMAVLDFPLPGNTDLQILHRSERDAEHRRVVVALEERRTC